MSAGLTRRTFLRGAAGVAVAVPFLPSLFGDRAARAAADDLAQKPRFVALFAPCGVWLDTWTPRTYDVNWQLSPTLVPLRPYKSRLTVISGLAATATNVPMLGFHQREAASWLTDTTIQPSFDAAALTNGWSLDQRIADAFHADAAFPSMQLGPRVSFTPMDPAKPYASAYEHAVSWRGDLPLLGMYTPQQVWLKLVGDGSSSLTGPLLDAERARQRSVLDLVTDDLASVRRRAGLEDQSRLDAYLTGLRTLEKDLARTTPPPTCTFDLPTEPTFSYPDQVETMLGILAHLLQCDVTRVVTALLNDASVSRVWTSLGHTQSHHDLSHHQGDLDKIAMIQQIDLQQVWILRRFLDLLDGMRDAFGASVLANTAVLYGSGMGDGNLHDYRDVPMLYVGDAAGRLVTGRHVRATDRPLADLHLALLQAYGVDATSFGDSVAPLTAIQA